MHAAAAAPSGFGAPWWGVAAISAGSIIGGVLIKWLIDVGTERGRRRREDHRWLIDKRLELYGDMASIMRAISQYVRAKPYEDSDPNDVWSVRAWREAVHDFDAAMDTSPTVMARMELLASPEVLKTVRKVHSDDEDEMHAIVERFLKAARRDLGVPGSPPW